MSILEKLHEANRRYMIAMEKSIDLTKKETELKLAQERVRKEYSLARDEMWALEQEAKQVRIHGTPLPEELKIA